jgi:hypothetical protein
MMFSSRGLSAKISRKSKKNIFGGTVPTNLQKFILIFYCLFKMTQGQMLLDPDPELRNVKSLDFAKPKLFFKNIRRYAATLSYTHVWIPFNFNQVLDTKNTIKQNYAILLDKHEEPFKSIAKTMTEVSLITFLHQLKTFKTSSRPCPKPWSLPH